MAHHLTCSEQYVHTRPSGSSTTPGTYLCHRLNGIQAVAKFTRGPLKIDVILSTEHPLQPIGNFWSTFVMNVITADGIICAYPEDTMALRGTVNITDSKHPHTRPTPGSPREAIEKYACRGFTSRGDHRSWQNSVDSSYTCDHSTLITCPTITRFFGDDHCLWIPFKDTPQMWAGNLDVICPDNRTVSWNLGGWCTGECPNDAEANEVFYEPHSVVSAFDTSDI